MLGYYYIMETKHLGSDIDSFKINLTLTDFDINKVILRTKKVIQNALLQIIFYPTIRAALAV